MSDGPLPNSRPMPSSFEEDDDFYNESASQKVLRKLKEEPLIPLGAGLTVAAFTSAYRASRRGDHHKVQRMFRARVAAQAFTVCAMVAGGWYYAEDRERTKERWKAEQMKKAEERHNKWIRELEARDAEEKAFQEKMEKRRKRAAEMNKTGSGSGNSETGRDGVAAQARAALKEAKEAKEAKETKAEVKEAKREAAGQDKAEKLEQEADKDKGNKTRSPILSSLGGMFGGSKKAPEDSTQLSEDPKPDPEGAEKK